MMLVWSPNLFGLNPTLVPAFNSLPAIGPHEGQVLTSFFGDRGIFNDFCPLLAFDN
jgi:hypothetical protein